MPIEVIDLFEVVGIDEIKNQIAVAFVTRIRIWRISSQCMLYIGFDSSGQEPPVPCSGQKIGHRGFPQVMVGAGEFFVQAILLDRQQGAHNQHGRKSQH